MLYSYVKKREVYAVNNHRTKLIEMQEIYNFVRMLTA